MAQVAKNGSTDHNAEALAKEIATLRADIERISGLVGDIAEDRAGAARRALDATANRAREAASQQVDHLADSARSAQSAAESAIRENPTLAIALASGVGFLVGMMTARR